VTRSKMILHNKRTRAAIHFAKFYEGVAN
jgi:hypothetical protein